MGILLYLVSIFNFTRKVIGNLYSIGEMYHLIVYGQASYRIYLVLGIFRWNVSRFCMLLELGMQVSIIQNPLSFHQKSVNYVCCLFYGLIKPYTEITYIWKMRPKIVKKCMSVNSVCCLFILSNKHHTETT